MAQSSPDEEDDGAEDLCSTSEEEEEGDQRKRHRKGSDDDLFELEESEDGDESDGSGSEEQQGRRPKSAKRRRPFPMRSSSSEAGDGFDQDEAALQQAIAMSMADPARTSGNAEAGPSSSQQQHYADAEEAALKQALEESLSNANSPAVRGLEMNARDGLRSMSLEPASASNHSQGEVPGGGEAVTAPTTKARSPVIPAKRKGKASVGGKPAFPAPTLAMVQQAFQMLDPTGSGTLNPYAIADVASKLLHKELDDEQVQAMMEFAESMTQEGGDHTRSRLVDAEAFCRLVARFASPEGSPEGTGRDK